jgi:hypothetical protein
VSAGHEDADPAPDHDIADPAELRMETMMLPREAF